MLSDMRLHPQSGQQSAYWTLRENTAGGFALEQIDSGTPSTLRQSLRIYQIEPIGYVLINWLRLPLPIIGGLFVFLFFGILFVLHSVAGTPQPPTFADIFRLPATFYYPNLIAVTYDFVGYPFLLTLLIFIRQYIPRQFIHLEREGLIKERPTTSRIAELLRFLSGDRRVQTITVIVAPVSVAFLGLLVDIRVSAPMGRPAMYAMFLSMLGRYGILVAFIQLSYILIILSNYAFDFRLHLNHPDQCSGLRPFGNLAMSSYSYLFALAMMLAVGTFASATYFDRAVRSMAGSAALAYLWILFPLALIVIFEQLIYKQHRVLRQLQDQYLQRSSTSWTEYHQQVTSAILGFVESSEAPLLDKADFSFSDDLEILEVWAKLDRYVTDMHTWPVPRHTLRTIVVLANPFIPILLPVVADAVRKLLL
jgi:hypothetical protein